MLLAIGFILLFLRWKGQLENSSEVFGTTNKKCYLLFPLMRNIQFDLHPNPEGWGFRRIIGMMSLLLL